MAKVIAMYRTPVDTAAFDRYYFSTHVPIAKRIPGLRSYEITRGPVVTLEGPAPYYLIAMLGFDSMAAIQAALASDAGKAAAADLGIFATGGVDLLLAESEMI